MRFAIRDDDTSYFTKPEELKAAYSFISSGPVSLSVVPFTVPCHEKGVLPYGEGIPFGYYPVGDNSGLVEFINECRYDVILHGYSHEYLKRDDVSWYPEMLWKDEDRIRAEIKEGKQYLEGLFKRPVVVFSAPNNAVDRRTIRALEAVGLDYSGIIMHRDRDFSVRYAANYLRRWGFRLRTGLRIPDVLDYGRHREMVSYPLDNLEKLKKEYGICKERGAPFSIYTHYWQLNRDESRKRMLMELYRYVTDDGARLVSISSCFREDAEE